jgi:hypothetical protein
MKTDEKTNITEPDNKNIKFVWITLLVVTAAIAGICIYQEANMRAFAGWYESPMSGEPQSEYIHITDDKCEVVTYIPSKKSNSNTGVYINTYSYEKADEVQSYDGTYNIINSEGEVIGINTVKITSAEGIGFAVPINLVKPIIESFKNNGEFNEAYLGIFAYDKNVIPYLDSSIDFNSGIYVAQISADGPSYNSGLKTGDIITRIDEIAINKMSELRSYIYTKKIGDKVNLTILRNNMEKVITIKLGRKN